MLVIMASADCMSRQLLLGFSAASKVGASAMNFVIAPMVLAGVGAILAIVGIYLVSTKEGATIKELMASLNKGVHISSLLIVVAAYFVTDHLSWLWALIISYQGHRADLCSLKCFVACLSGRWSLATCSMTASTFSSVLVNLCRFQHLCRSSVFTAAVGCSPLWE